MEITPYRIGNITLWDTPGFAESGLADNQHKTDIWNKLHEQGSHDGLLIDSVLVVLDGSSSNLDSVYDFVNNVIKPIFASETEKRVVFGINQADIVLDGRYWDSAQHKPKLFLEENLADYKMRVHDGLLQNTGISAKPVVYSAGSKEDGKKQEDSYNLQELFGRILFSMSREKRFPLLQATNFVQTLPSLSAPAMNYIQNFAPQQFPALYSSNNLIPSNNRQIIVVKQPKKKNRKSDEDFKKIMSLMSTGFVGIAEFNKRISETDDKDSGIEALARACADFFGWMAGK